MRLKDLEHKKRARAALNNLTAQELALGRELLKELAMLLPDAALRKTVIQKAIELAALQLTGMRRANAHEQEQRAGKSELADIATLLRMPVAPVKDASGRIIGAQRVAKLP